MNMYIVKTVAPLLLASLLFNLNIKAFDAYESFVDSRVISEVQDVCRACGVDDYTDITVKILPEEECASGVLGGACEREIALPLSYAHYAHSDRHVIYHEACHIKYGHAKSTNSLKQLLYAMVPSLLVTRACYHSNPRIALGKYVFMGIACWVDLLCNKPISSRSTISSVFSTLCFIAPIGTLKWVLSRALLPAETICRRLRRADEMEADLGALECMMENRIAGYDDAACAKREVDLKYVLKDRSYYFTACHPSNEQNYRYFAALIKEITDGKEPSITEYKWNYLTELFTGIKMVQAPERVHEAD